MTVTINLTMPNFAGIVTGLGVCVVDALGQTDAGEPGRVCYLIPTAQIAWDDCDCTGQYGAAITSVFSSNRPPQPINESQAKCSPRYWVARVAISTSRCVPTAEATQGGIIAPPCDDVLIAALYLEQWRIATRQALACCLGDYYDARQIAGYTVGPSLTVGEQGGCSSIETEVFIWIQGCSCPGPCSYC